LQNY